MQVTERPAPRVAPNISSLVPYRPGKPIEEVKRELGLDRVVKLASNENNLGPSPLALEAARDAAARVYLYPEGSCHDLRLAVALHVDVPPDHLVFGNGSDDVLRLAGLTYLTPGDEIIQADPTFSQYEAAAILNGATIVRVRGAGWRHDVGAMAEQITARTRILFVCNPNNPTGTALTGDEVGQLMDRVPDSVIVVFDEAYREYATTANYPDTQRYVREGRNVVVLRTFSKIYGMAGLRLGYGIARPEVVAQLEQVREPFNVNLIAQAAGIAALSDLEHVQRSLAMNEAGKELFYQEFRRLGLDYLPTEANFVWVDVGRNCREVFDRLLRRGVIVRTGDVFGAPTHIRVTIGRPEENALFVEALEDELKR